MKRKGFPTAEREAGQARTSLCRFSCLLFSALTFTALLGGAPSGAGAQQVQINVYGDVDFPDADPDVTPVIGPIQLRIRVNAPVGPGSLWTLTLLADTDLTSGTDVIPASSVSWVASPSPPFQDGTLSTTVPTLVGSGTTSAHQWGMMDFYLLNSWGYEPGSYTAQATYTLSIP